MADLEQVWLMPNANPPHRGEPAASSADRMRMVEIALAGRPGLVASRLEIERGGTSYTIDTIRELAERFPGQRFELLLGADAAQQIRGWHHADAALLEGRFVIFDRPGTRLDDATLRQLGFQAGRIRRAKLSTPDISAHAVRARLAAGQPVGSLLPDAVLQYIRTHHLYGA